MSSPPFSAEQAVTFDLSFGHVHIDGAAHRVLVPATGLAALFEAAGDEPCQHLGDEIGVALGKRIAGRLAQGLTGDARFTALSNISLSVMTEHLAGELALLGFGALSVEQWGRALVLVVDQSPMGNSGDVLLGAILGAAFNQLSSEALAVIRIDRLGVRARFLVAEPEAAASTARRLQAGGVMGRGVGGSPWSGRSVMSQQEQLESLLARVRDNRDRTPKPRLVLQRQGSAPAMGASAAEEAAPISEAVLTPRVDPTDFATAPSPETDRNAGAASAPATEAHVMSLPSPPPVRPGDELSDVSDPAIGTPKSPPPLPFVDESPTMASALGGTPPPADFDASNPITTVSAVAPDVGAVPNPVASSPPQARGVRFDAPPPPPAAPRLPSEANQPFELKPIVIQPERHGASVADLIVEDSKGGQGSFGAAVAAALTLRFSG